MKSRHQYIGFLFLMGLLIAIPAHAQQYSELWGESGGRWSPKSRLPDFSYAGYHFGEDPIPHDIEVAVDVRGFGAVGDGETDDTQAFLDAIAATDSGAVLVPEGRYLITQILWIEKPNVVLRGAGPDKTVLYFPTPLDELRPNPSQTTSGRPTSGYSWSGGVVWIKGSLGMRSIAPIVNETERGDRVIEIESPTAFGDTSIGDRITVELQDDEQKSLLTYLYSGDPGDTRNVTKPITVRFVSRIAAIEGSTITLDRPLRYDIRKEWSPTLSRFEPTVRECGIENLAIEFPNTPYEGHFTEVGYNGIAINGASDCWVRDVRITNSDSGIYATGMFCTVNRLVIDSERQANRGTTGHHGITLGTDNLVTNFDLQTHFIHDITVSYVRAGNVIKNGKGTNLSLDHHKKAPHENLFCNLDLGEGTEMWRCGGGASLGKHCGARGTFWRIRAKRDQSWPSAEFGPVSMNLIGVQAGADAESILNREGKWFETISPVELRPIDLHAAQLEKRLRERGSGEDSGS